jgi:signal transduction histidine kinase
MQNVVSLARAAALSLIFVQAVLLIARGLARTRRLEPFLLSGFLACLGLLVAFPGEGIGRILCSVGASWTAGVFTSRLLDGGRGGASTAACAGSLAVLIPVGLLGYGGAPFIALRGFAELLPAFFPLRSLARVSRHGAPPSTHLALAAACIWIAAEAVGLLARTETAHAGASAAGLLLSLSTGWLVLQEGWPERAGWGGRLPALTGAAGASRLIAARLLESESALERQNRLAAFGLLSLGAAHEFKNVLSLIAITAQHGLEEGPRAREESLRLVLEQAGVARVTAVETMERLSAEHEERTRVVEPARDLARILGLLRPALRGQGLVVIAELAAEVRFRCKPADVELAVVNLVRNAAEAYGARDGDGGGTITVAARAEDGHAVLEVRDRAGGIPSSRERQLFSPPGSGHGSTGLGLFLSRRLVERNGGGLEHVPVDGGSLFRLSFPLVDDGT